MSGADYVYVWVDGIHFGVRLDQDRVCTLVIIGVRADGKKELVALTDGHRESTESWAGLLRDCKRRGMRAPVLAVGDGALGFWAALREVFPETKQQRDWVHKVMNVLDCLPKSAQPAARKALAQIRDAEDRAHAEKAVKEFAAAYRAKYPKAVAKITEDKEQLLAFFDFPAEHWVHLKTSNPIESTFATVRLRTRVTKGPGSRAAGLAMVFKLVKAAAKITDDEDQLLAFFAFPAEHWVHLKTSNPIESTFATVRLRTKVTKGPGSRAAGLAMVFKLIEAASERWRYVNGPHLVALVRAGAKFEKGVLIERPDEAKTKVAA